MMQTRRVLSSVLIAASLAGCAHSLVYDEARDKQAQEAKRAAGELKIADAIRALQKGHAEVAVLEVGNAKAAATVLRDKQVARVARAPVLRGSADPAGRPMGFIDVLERDMQRLGAMRKDAVAQPAGPRRCGVLDCRALDDLENWPVRLAARETAFDISRGDFRASYGYAFGTCAEVRSAASTSSARPMLNDSFVAQIAAARANVASATKAYGDLVANCDAIDEARKRIDAAIEGGDDNEIRKAQTEADREDASIASYRAQLVEVKAKLAAAIAGLSEQQAAVAAPKQGIQEQLDARTQQIKAVVDEAKEAVGALSNAGIHASAQETVVQLDTVIGAITGEKADADKLSNDERAAVAFARAVPELAAEADKLLREAGKPRIAPFVIAREHYRLAAKGLDDALAIRIQRAEALRARADALTRELSALAQVHRLLTLRTLPDGKEVDPGWEQLSIAQIDAQRSAKEREQLYQALGIYWDDVFRHSMDEKVWKARATALTFDANFAQSEAVAEQWDNVIGGVATVLADYHASGVKPAEIAEFLKAFGLIYIGARVP
ncbi:MAG TPA: hypothetical protein VMV45_14865 [Casimicrobiaceae bacterium]|nr:hypothetical protein [Casimicrobiaceae bacterium]